MRLILHTIPLFTLNDSFNGCIVIDFPSGGKILDIVTTDQSAVLLVQADINAGIIKAHFHTIPVNVPIFTDSFEYVGTAPMVINDVPYKFVIARIPEGDFGQHSKEYELLKPADSEPLKENETVNMDDIYKHLGLKPKDNPPDDTDMVV